MKRMVHNRLICILLTISMLVLGMYCDDIRTDSSFLHACTTSETASLQAADSALDTHVYYEKSSLSLIENFMFVRQSSRGTAGLRISQLLIAALLLIGAYLITLSLRTSFLCTDATSNQYRQRTLEYIHHKDGKKA